jgi:hypothetical protein
MQSTLPTPSSSRALGYQAPAMEINICEQIMAAETHRISMSAIFARRLQGAYQSERRSDL